ncbi:MAG: casein kinase [Sylvanvirus sp.]|uniref:non-specific serine/threonine protein kinase n=1 Tax=Sylvanvirus sp. TaxID=2487774 RepID=A0A3G5AHB2_9VIRU|nr:MAG: casein kinase [Sylvanvirus sp.]
MNGDIQINKYRINAFFDANQIPAEVTQTKAFARGSYGAVFQGELKGKPVVIKVALSKCYSNHTLKEEADLYKYVGQYHHLNIDPVITPEMGTGFCYYHGSEEVHADDRLKWSKRDAKRHKVEHPRPDKCLEVASLKHNNESGLCQLKDCRACNKKRLVLHVMIMSKFGSSVRQVQKNRKQRVLNVSTVAKVIVVLLMKLQWLHAKGLIHRDMKPNNIVIPSEPSDPLYANVYLIDFGLSKPWRTSGGSHVQSKNPTGKHSGTIYWIGTHAHQGYECSRRDDLQALAIIALDLLLGDLPWEARDNSYKKHRGKRNSSSSSVYKLKTHRDTKMLQDKLEYIKAVDRLTEKYVPREFADFLKYTHKLGFTQDPDYGMWINTFITLIDRENWNTCPVDWADQLVSLFALPPIKPPGLNVPTSRSLSNEEENGYTEPSSSSSSRRKSHRRARQPHSPKHRGPHSSRYSRSSRSSGSNCNKAHCRKCQHDRSKPYKHGKPQDRCDRSHRSQCSRHSQLATTDMTGPTNSYAKRHAMRGLRDYNPISWIRSFTTSPC